MNSYVRCQNALKFIAHVNDKIHWGIMIFNGILIKMSYYKESPTDVRFDRTKTIYFIDVEEINSSEFV